MRQSTIEIPIAIAAILGFEIWSQDFQQAYLHSLENLAQNVFMKPQKIPKRSEEETIELLKHFSG